MRDLFIIGAGASKPYGFPTGEELFKTIRGRNYDFDKTNRPNNDLKKDYERYFWNQETYDVNSVMQQMCKFSSDIKNSSMISIDDFLRNRKNLSDNQNRFGKIVIADKILTAEKNYQTIARYKNKIDWFNYLFSFIDRNESIFKDFFDDSMFITFNYDRLLERKIFEYLHYDKNYEERKALEKIDDMKIFHVNGYIGRLKEFEFGKNEEKKRIIWRGICKVCRLYVYN